jgi:Flp pilus assembly pilin Flp
MTPTVRGMFVVAKGLVTSEEGAALIEYGMLVMLIALLCIIALKTIGSKVANGFNSANTLLP